MPKCGPDDIRGGRRVSRDIPPIPVNPAEYLAVSSHIPHGAQTVILARHAGRAATPAPTTSGLAGACPLKSRLSRLVPANPAKCLEVLSRIPRGAKAMTLPRVSGQGRGFSSVGPPASFQAPKPPAMWATGLSPMFCAACVASAERIPPAQKKTNFLPLAKKGLW